MAAGPDVNKEGNLPFTYRKTFYIGSEHHMWKTTFLFIRTYMNLQKLSMFSDLNNRDGHMKYTSNNKTLNHLYIYVMNKCFELHSWI